MGIQDRRQREREEVQRKILDAARALFAERGYEAVTLRKIAEQIEYSPTAIYLHFRDKETLIRAICADDFASLATRFQKIQKMADPIARLAATGRAYAEFGLRHPNHYRLMFMTPHLPPDVAAADSPKSGNPEENAYAFLRAIVAEAIAAGRLRPELVDVDLVAQTLWASVHGVVSLRISLPDDAGFNWRSEKEAVDIMIDAVLRGLVHPGDPILHQGNRP